MKIRNFYLYAPFVLLVFNFYVWSHLLGNLWSREDMVVAFFDVGQGDAIFIEVPNGLQFVIDGGPNEILLRKIGKFMSFGDRHLDFIMISNPDKDHITSFGELIKRYSIGAVFESGTITTTAIYDALSNKILEKKIPVYYPKTGDTLVLDHEKNVVLTFLFPDRDVSGLKVNDGSIIAKLSYGEVCFIFTGDAPRLTEDYVASLYGDQIDCQVLKVGHHGSKTSSSPYFVSKVSPDYSIISVGKDNKYGHPHIETISTLEDKKSRLLRTDTDGDIVFRTDGKILLLSSLEN
jgi:competence protein ComEC